MLGHSLGFCAHEKRHAIKACLSNGFCRLVSVLDCLNHLGGDYRNLGTSNFVLKCNGGQRLVRSKLITPIASIHPSHVFQRPKQPRPRLPLYFLIHTQICNHDCPAWLILVTGLSIWCLGSYASAKHRFVNVLLNQTRRFKFVVILFVAQSWNRHVEWCSQLRQSTVH